jgi:hypothetical protein
MTRPLAWQAADVALLLILIACTVGMLWKGNP